MSEEQKQSVNGKEHICSSSDDVVLEGGGERLNSNTTNGVRSTDDLAVNSEQDLGYIDGGIEIQATDVMIIEPDKMCYESNSDEGLETATFCQYPSESDEDYCSPLPRDYFDDAANFHPHLEPEVFINSVPQVRGNQKNDSDNTPREEALDGGGSENDASKPSAGTSKTCSATGSKNGRVLNDSDSLVPEMLYKTCQVIEIHQTPMYEINHIKPKTNRKVKPGNCKQSLGYLECNSDEFADVEDNTDSPPENNKFPRNPTKPKIQLNGAYVAEKLAEESEDDIFDGKKALKKAECPRSDSVRSKVVETEYIFSDPVPSCSYSPQYKSEPTNAFLGGNIPEANKNTEKKTMDTIVEIPECEEEKGNSKISEPLVSRTNPLKMKSSVVNKKVKCNVCNVRLGLCAIRCRCGGYYCAKHRYDREHNCTFDYKSLGQDEIRRNNPQVVAEKVRKL